VQNPAPVRLVLQGLSDHPLRLPARGEELNHLVDLVADDSPEKHWTQKKASMRRKTVDRIHSCAIEARSPSNEIACSVASKKYGAPRTTPE
jgi:hypothetical protein